MITAQKPFVQVWTAAPSEAYIEALLDNLDNLKTNVQDLLLQAPGVNQDVRISMTFVSPPSTNNTSTSSCTLSDGNVPLRSERSSNKQRCPSARAYSSLPPCRSPSCNSSDIHEDAAQGCVVCFQCGLIQSSYVFENASTDAVFHGGTSRIAVHHYSRIAILRGILLSLQGETRLVLHQKEKELLQSYFPEGDPPKNAIAIKKAIRALHLPYRLVHHATTIWYELWRGPTPNPSEKEIREVLRLFRALENEWDRLPLAGSIRNGRRKFLSLPLTWKFLCNELEYPALGEIMDELQIKNEKNRQRQLATLNILLTMSRA